MGANLHEDSEADRWNSKKVSATGVEQQVRGDTSGNNRERSAAKNLVFPDKAMLMSSEFKIYPNKGIIKLLPTNQALIWNDPLALA